MENMTVDFAWINLKRKKNKNITFTKMSKSLEANKGRSLTQRSFLPKINIFGVESRYLLKRCCGYVIFVLKFITDFA
jgi:hypothetical protein